MADYDIKSKLKNLSFAGKDEDDIFLNIISYLRDNAKDKNVWNDLSETNPLMMYVETVSASTALLSYYMDSQFQELHPLHAKQEYSKRNLINGFYNYQVGLAKSSFMTLRCYTRSADSGIINIPKYTQFNTKYQNGNNYYLYTKKEYNIDISQLECLRVKFNNIDINKQGYEEPRIYGVVTNSEFTGLRVDFEGSVLTPLDSSQSITATIAEAPAVELTFLIDTYVPESTIEDDGDIVVIPASGGFIKHIEYKIPDEFVNAEDGTGYYVYPYFDIIINEGIVKEQKLLESDVYRNKIVIPSTEIDGESLSLFNENEEWRKLDDGVFWHIDNKNVDRKVYSIRENSAKQIVIELTNDWDNVVTKYDNIIFRAVFATTYGDSIEIPASTPCELTNTIYFSDGVIANTSLFDLQTLESNSGGQKRLDLDAELKKARKFSRGLDTLIAPEDFDIYISSFPGIYVSQTYNVNDRDIIEDYLQTLGYTLHGYDIYFTFATTGLQEPSETLVNEVLLNINNKLKLKTLNIYYIPPKFVDDTVTITIQTKVDLKKDEISNLIVDLYKNITEFGQFIRKSEILRVVKNYDPENIIDLTVDTVINDTNVNPFDLVKLNTTNITIKKINAIYEG